MTRRRLIGPGIVVAALLTVGLLVAVTVVRGRVVRPDQRDLPLPPGVVVRYADESCRRVDATTICDVVLAVGPAAGVQLRRAAAELLAAHLRRADWAPVPGRAATLRSPDGTMLAVLRGFEALRWTQPDRAAAVRRAVPEHVETRELAVVYLVAHNAPAR